MNKYIVYIEQVSQTRYEIQAKSADAARDLARECWLNDYGTPRVISLEEVVSTERTNKMMSLGDYISELEEAKGSCGQLSADQVLDRLRMIQKKMVQEACDHAGELGIECSKCGEFLGI